MHILCLKSSIFVQKGSQMKRIGLIVFTILAAAAVVSCDNDRYIAITGYAQGGTYAVKFNMKGVSEKPETIRRNVDSLLLLIDNTLSGYNKGSMLSRFNAGEGVELNGMFRDIYSRSRAVWEETGGAVDVAAGPIFDAWGFGFNSGEMPSGKTVDSLRAACGMGRLPETADSAATMHPVLNFNAIAQGYSCDVIAGYLRGLGVKDMLVDIGEIYCSGVNPEGHGWSIGIDLPVDGNDTPGAELKGIWNSDGKAVGIVTSGNYRKFYVRDGRKYAHTIDPRTGYPVSHQLLSATVVASDATLADAYATYCMVIGLEESIEFITSSEGIEGYLIFDKDGEMETWASEGFNVTATK